MKTIINRIIRYDDGGEMSFNENLSIFMCYLTAMN
jgi:hypothetical protein